MTEGTMGGRPLRTMATSKIAIMAACLFAASGMAWAMLPASEAGGYGEWTVAKGGGGELGVTDKGVVTAAPVVSTMTMHVEDGGRDDGLGGGGADRTGAGGLGDAAPAGGGADATVGTVDGPAGSAQGWCKKGLEARTNANTGDMVCVPYGYADGEDGAKWIEPRSGPVDGAARYGGIAGGGGTGRGAAGASAGDGRYGERMDGTSGITWKWVSPQEARLVAVNEPAGAYDPSLKEQIADLEEINEGLMRTVARLQEALMEIHLEGRGVVNGGGSADFGIAGRAWPSDGGKSNNLAQAPVATATATAPAVPSGGEDAEGDVCLHGTDAMFTSVIDPAALPETGGSLGAIPMPDGRYTVLLMAASSTPVSVGIGLVGDGGLEYDLTFTLEDTGRPPGADATMWDYNSGAAELVLDRPQLVNATAAVTGGDGLPVFASLARCR